LESYDHAKLNLSQPESPKVCLNQIVDAEKWRVLTKQVEQSRGHGPLKPPRFKADFA
jgi:hypothetical protein